jgi:rhomboid protease GluP
MLVSGIDWLNPAVDKVLQWGADYGPLTFNGQYWRLITSMFLHFGIIHIAGNMWCLWSLGQLAEKLLDSSSVIGAYLLTGVGASLLSLSWDPMRVSAGASGAIFGIAGVLITTLYYGKHNLPKESVRRLLGYVVRFSFLNLLFGLRGHVDNMAHLGGLVSGLIIGLFLARSFTSPVEQRTHQRRTVLAIGVAVLLVFLVPIARAKQYAAEFGKGQIAFDQKAYKAAIEHMQKYVAERPNDAYAHAILGTSLENTGHLDNAVHEYELALAAAPNYDYVKENLVELYVKQNKPEKAIPLFPGIQQIKDAETLYFYGQALSQTGDLSQAENALRKSIRADGKLIESHQLLSQVLQKEGKTEEAKAEQDIADLLEPESASPDSTKPAK